MPFDFTRWKQFGSRNSHNQEESDCKRYQRIIGPIIDGESTSDDRRFFQDHLIICRKCLERFMVDKELKDRVKKIRKKNVPSDVIISILEKIEKAA